MRAVRLVRHGARLALVAGALGLPLGCGGEDGAGPGPAPPAPPAARAPYDRDGHRLSGGPAPSGLPNVLLIVIDTLRADALDGEPTRMPRLLARAGAGVRFANACAPAPWTVPSMTSLLTGLLPSVHGSDAPMQPPRLVDAVTTFAEALKNGYGYETAAFTEGPWYDRESRLLQGFGYTLHGFMLQGVEQQMSGWARRRDPERPFFALLHSFEAHDPYGPRNHPFPPPSAGVPPFSRVDVTGIHDPAELTRWFLLDRAVRLDLTHQRGPAYRKAVVHYMDQGYRADPRPELARELKDAYMDGVAWLDEVLDRALAQMQALGLLDDTLVVVTSDHGEAFGEHGILGHGRQLYDELLRIPLVAFGRAPFEGGRVIHGSVGLVDLLPTLFDWAGLEPLPEINGRSFLPLLAADGPGGPVFSEDRLGRENTGADRLAQLTSVRSARWKYIVTYDLLAGTVVEEAYDLVRDPREREDLCQGRGRIDGLAFDPEFCAAVEAARDRIWGAVAGTHRRLDTPYAAGEAQVTSPRPRACGEAETR